MEMLNRSAVIVKPRQPYLEWARRDDVETCWLKNRTIEMFSEWFVVQMNSIVHDLYLDEPLEYIE